MKTLAILVLGCAIMIATSSCSAYWVQKQYYPNRAGAVSFLNEGASSVIADRRADAISKITEFCGADGYTITSEGYQDQPSGVLATSVGNSAIGTVVSSDHDTIYFTCGAPYRFGLSNGAPTPARSVDAHASAPQTVVAPQVPQNAHAASPSPATAVAPAEPATEEHWERVQ